MELFKLLSKKDVQDFMAVFPELILDIMLENEKWSQEELGLTQQWLSHIILNNVPSGEISAGLATALAYRHLAKNPSKEDIKLSYVLGWCVEMISSSLLMMDDLIDSSEMRNGEPCWHIRESRGYNAVEDAALIESSVYFILKKYFSHKESYTKLVETFDDAAFKTSLGQSLDISSSVTKNGQVDQFNWALYNPIARYKASYAPTSLHIKLALHFAGIKDQNVIDTALNISREIDYHYQVKDDFVDCFGSEEEIGSDIQEGKCSWNICKALELADEEQKRELIEIYGQKELEKSDRVKEIYIDLNLIEIFDEYEKKKFAEIMELAENTPEELPKALFVDMAWISFPNMYYEGSLIINSDQNQEAVEVDNAEPRLTLEDLKELTKEISNFMKVFPQLVEYFFEDPELQDLIDLWPWLAFVFQYNVPNGKRTRGLTTALCCKELKFNFSSKEDQNKAYILGWCVEALQAAALVADDIMDKSEKRRGRPCWYKMVGLGNDAFNDSYLLENAIYYILKKNFGEEEYYKDILEIFQDVIFKTGLGQSLDVQTGLYCKMEDFSMERYSSIVKYKTSYYTFYLPIALGLALGGVNDQDTLEETKNVLLDIGHFFQVQDDWLDCFGDIKQTGKIGTDIADGKCSWLVISALEKVNEKQRQILQDNYGKGVDDKEKIQAVKDLFIDLKIPEIYREYEAKTYEFIKGQIDDLPDEAFQRKMLLQKVLETTYKRDA